METLKPLSKGALWSGWIISILCILFLLFDSITKVLKTVQTMEGSAQIGWPENYIQGLGFVLLICTILYIIPRTAVLGAILLTGYLGGATAIMARMAAPGHPYLFPVIFGILVWAGLYLRDRRLQNLIPFKRK